MSQEKTKIVFFDSSSDRANSLLVRFPNAIQATSVANLAEIIRQGRVDILIINTEEHAVDSLLNWMITYYPVIRRIYLYGHDFEEIVHVRVVLQAAGYQTFYQEFPHLLTFISI